VDENPSITLGFGPDDIKVKMTFEFEDGFPIEEDLFVMEIAKLIQEGLS
jgi:hypothetical protein